MNDIITLSNSAKASSVYEVLNQSTSWIMWNDMWDEGVVSPVGYCNKFSILSRVSIRDESIAMSFSSRAILLATVF